MARAAVARVAGHSIAAEVMSRLGATTGERITVELAARACERKRSSGVRGAASDGSGAPCAGAALVVRWCSPGPGGTGCHVPRRECRREWGGGRAPASRRSRIFARPARPVPGRLAGWVAVAARGDGPRRRRLAGGSAPRWARVRSGSRAARRVASGRVGALASSSLDATRRTTLASESEPRVVRAPPAAAPPAPRRAVRSALSKALSRLRRSFGVGSNFDK